MQLQGASLLCCVKIQGLDRKLSYAVEEQLMQLQLLHFESVLLLCLLAPVINFV